MYYVIDFETFWDSKNYTLSKMGPVEYIRDSRFEVQLMAVADLFGGGGAVHGCPTAIAQAIGKTGADPDGVVIGHNIAGFDALILSERYNVHPRHIWDTIAMANWTGVSRVVRKQHATVTDFLGHGVKKAGTVVSNGKHWPQDFSLAEQQFFIQYCHDDATQCAANAASMLNYMTPDALQFMSITARMATEPVFELDEQLLADYIRQLEDDVKKARADIMSVFRFDSDEEFLRAVRSAPKFAVMLTSLGVEPPMKVSDAKTATKRAQLDAAFNAAETEEERLAWVDRMEKELPVMTYAFSKQDLDFLALREHEDPRVRLLVETRLQHNSSIMLSRAQRFYSFAKDHKPIPVVLSAFNAHTSRYTAGSADDSASDKLQFQNLSKRDPSKLALRRAIKAPAGYRVVACDSSQVEARTLAWLANETGLLAQFREGRDPYSELAEVIFGVPAAEIKAGAKIGDKKLKHYRNIAKKAVLGCGYGISAGRFSDTLLREGSRMGDTDEKHKQLAFHAHAVYRAAHPNIVNFWTLCGKVVRSLAEGYHGFFGGPTGDLFEYGLMPICGSMKEYHSIRFPSGYILRYPNLRVEPDEEGRPVYYYDRIRGNNTVKTKVYGSAMVENLTQMAAFQVLMWQACRMDEAGVQLKVNIHDSFATVVPEQDVDRTRQLMEKWMSAVPDWAAGLPIACESEVGDDFTVV